MTRTEDELRNEYEEYSRMYNNPKHWESWLIDEIGRMENSLEKVHKLAEFLTIEAGKHSIRCKELEHDIETLELKAAAYDRLMRGGKKTLKEWANLLYRPVAIDFGGVAESFGSIPMRYDSAGYWYCDENAEDFEDEHFIIPKDVVDYTGSWQASLTLPDGWEE